MNTERFNQAIKAFDVANAEDPNVESHEGKEFPSEVLYAKRMSQCLEELNSDASKALRLAVRSQHICRWEIARTEYPDGRKGYLSWRLRLARHHAETAGRILEDVGYENEFISRVQSLLLKKNLKHDNDAQTLEDVSCIVFLMYYFPEFAVKHDDEKLIRIIQKTWKKMSGRGHRAALALPLGPRLKLIVEKALE